MANLHKLIRRKASVEAMHSLRKLLFVCLLMTLFVLSTGVALNSSAASSDRIHNVTKITVGTDPRYILFDPSNNLLYVADYVDQNFAGLISVVNPATNTVVANVTVGEYPISLAYAPSNNEIYVASNNNCCGSAVVSVIDGSTNKLVTNVRVTGYPVWVTFDPSNKDVFVAGIENISVISTTTNTVVENISAPAGALAYDPSNGYMYAADESFGATTGGNTVAVISPTNKVVATITVGNDPSNFVYDPFNGDMYAINQYSGTVSAIDSTTNKVVATILARGQSLIYNPSNHEVIVSGQEGLSAISGNKVVATASADCAADTGNSCLVYNPTNKDVYFDNSTGSVSVLNSANSVIKTLKVSYPGFFAYDPTTQEVYVTHSQGTAAIRPGTVFVISS